jgi:hypothetical protein
MTQSNFGKSRSDFNDVTGDAIRSKIGSQDKFEENFKLIGSGVEYKQPDTLFPVTIRLPKEVFKEIERVAATLDTTLQELIEVQVLHSFNK